MTLKDERSPKYAFPEAGTFLLKSPTKSLLYYVSHTFLNAGYWLAASCCTAVVALTATDAAGTLEKNSITAAAAAAGAADPSKRRFRQGNPMLEATATAAAVPTKTQPCRTGKHHGPEGRTESKICVSRGRNVPSEIS